ncbi:hypothetical protein BLNAU_11439 [Blattamonas nauphoetae]|uniref:Uncharacterized protein n=1 Tax=Blattamonas nauphoetae TaxID=2049346 RepID=A0ABQ9XSJ4_9EUKA|nr:hypothetical protein BLNAU_11439 [Blattamonas nauphoetae]
MNPPNPSGSFARCESSPKPILPPLDTLSMDSVQSSLDSPTFAPHLVEPLQFSSFLPCSPADISSFRSIEDLFQETPSISDPNIVTTSLEALHFASANIVHTRTLPVQIPLSTHPGAMFLSSQSPLSNSQWNPSIELSPATSRLSSTKCPDSSHHRSPSPSITSSPSISFSPNTSSNLHGTSGLSFFSSNQSPTSMNSAQFSSQSLSHSTPLSSPTHHSSAGHLRIHISPPSQNATILQPDYHPKPGEPPDVLEDPAIQAAFDECHHRTETDFDQPLVSSRRKRRNLLRFKRQIEHTFAKLQQSATFSREVAILSESSDIGDETSSTSDFSVKDPENADLFANDSPQTILSPVYRPLGRIVSDEITVHKPP